MPTTPSPEPALVKVQGINFLLYTAGIKQGHAEACEEMAANTDRLAAAYKAQGEAGAPAASLFEQMGKELRERSVKAAADAAVPMKQALEALQRVEHRDAIVPPQPSWWRRILHQLIRLAA